MLKLNRINLKLHEFENKYIKSANKSKDTGSTSDDSISNFELTPKLNINGDTNPKSHENSSELEDEPPQTNVSGFELQNLEKLTNGHATVNEEPKIFTRSNLMVKTSNRSKAFNVMENIKLISLDESAETDNEDIKKSSVESVSEAKISAQSDIKAKSQPDNKFSSINNFKALSRKFSTESVSEKISSSDDNKDNDDIVEDLASPVSDIIEDVGIVLTDESLSSVQSDVKTASKNISSEASSVSEVMNYNYSSEFEKLSDASKTKRQNEIQTDNLKKVSKIQADDKDATLANSSELDQTQSYVRVSESNGTESEQSNQARSYGKTLENTPVSRLELISPIHSDNFDGSFRKKEAFQNKIANKSDSENKFSEKSLRAEKSERKERSRTDSEKSKSNSDDITSFDEARDCEVREENDRVNRDVSVNMHLNKSHLVEKSKRRGGSRRSSEVRISGDNEIISSSVDTDQKVCEEDDRKLRNASKNVSPKKCQKSKKSRHRDVRTSSEESKSSDNGITSYSVGTDREVRGKSNEYADNVQVLKTKAARGSQNFEKSGDNEAVNKISASDTAANFEFRDKNGRVKRNECTREVQSLGHKSARGLSENFNVSEVSDNDTSSDAVTDRKIRARYGRAKSRHKEDETSPCGAKSKASENLIVTKNRERMLRKSKNALKSPDSNSEKWNNCDSQGNSVLSSAVSHQLVDTGTITNRKVSVHRSKDKDTVEKEAKKTDSIRTIKNDISSEFGTKKENGPREKADSNSAKCPENNYGSPEKIPKNTQSVNTQTSPKVCFEEDFKSGGEKLRFEENFRTSPKNFCNCCPNHNRRPMDFVAFKSSNGSLETAMNHLLMGQLRFIQNMMEKQNQSHKLNRQIIQQLNLSKR